MPRKAKTAYECSLCHKPSVAIHFVSAPFQAADGKQGIAGLLVCNECIANHVRFTVDCEGKAALARLEGGEVANRDNGR